MISMPSDTLSVLGQKILLAVWKSNALGVKGVTEDALKTEVADSTEGFPQELKTLEDLGFIIKGNSNSPTQFTLTPLGLAILRQVEEDKLQELR